MSKQLVVTRATSPAVIAECIRSGATFANKGKTFGGLVPTGTPKRGVLGSEAYDSLLRSRPTYIIYSYDTPIAWRSHGGAWNTWGYSFSVTTYKHQSQASRIIAAFNGAA